MAPKFTLVGAGPGDPDLITLKGIKALESANVVLYDALLDDVLLDYAPNAVKIFVGKRKGKKAYSQDQIHELIVKHAFNFGHVVRLKGGDSFVFGRGSEEIDFVSNYDIPIEVVPGISSTTAVPASLGISVTQRYVSESYWVITGTTSDHELSRDIAHAARTTATVVVLMGFGKLDQIVDQYKYLHKGDMPIAVIQNGTKKNEKYAVGTIDTIQEIVLENAISTPALIVIGKVVSKSHRLKNLFIELQMNENQLIA